MLDKIFRWLITILGLAAGYFITSDLAELDFFQTTIKIKPNSLYAITLLIAGTIVVGLIFFLIAPFIIKILRRLTELIENGIQKIPAGDILMAVGGLITGLVIANLILFPFIKLLPNTMAVSVISSILFLIFNIVFATISMNVAIKKKDDIFSLFQGMKKFNKDKKSKNEMKNQQYQPKILDTSVIIDGRILDILKTGFIEGTIIIPSFVLEELRHIADSSDNLKRARGRRGLDILNQIQKELFFSVEISDRNFENIQEVDSKLLKLAEVSNGVIITNDFNLNKVAEFKGVKVLNINELSNAVKPVLIPGEEMNISIVKDGKESGQGVAYLDDGTMIVVEGGKRYVGEVVDVVVTSVLQTAAGRMIFARVKTAQDKVS